MGYKYDAFISHAVEDKIGLVNDLCRKLEELKVNVWYSGKDLQATDSLEESFEEAIRKSRFGVVVLSPNYFAKDWTMAEFHQLWARDGKTKEPRVVIPVYYGVTVEDVVKRKLLLGDRWAINASKGVDHVAQQINDIVTKETLRTAKAQRINWAVGIVVAALLFLGAFAWYQTSIANLPKENEISALIEERVAKIDESGKSRTSQQSVFAAFVPKIFADSVYRAYNSTKSYYRNEYEFTNGFDEIRSKKNVNAVLGASMHELNPGNIYGMDSADVVVIKQSPREAVYGYINRAPIVKNVEVISESDKLQVVRVHYKNNIRYIEVSLQFPTSSKDTKRHRMRVTGLKPTETYQLVKSGMEWKLKEIETQASETN